MIFLLIALSLLFLGISFKLFYDYSAGRQELVSHLQEVAEERFIGSKVHKKKSNRERIIGRMLRYADDFSNLGHRINFFSESQDIKRLLMQAGYPYNLTVERFQGLKIFLLIVGFILGIASYIIGLPYGKYLILILPIAGYIGVIFWLRGKAKKRQDELSYDLPDFLDTISVTLQAGVHLDRALRDIIPYFPGPIQEEFSRFIYEIDLGVERRRAYETLIERNDNHEFQKLIKSLIQGERLGVPIATTFKIQAEELRKMKKEKVKELAAKASPKVTLITTFIVMPTAMILIGGLMIMNMFTGDNNLFELFK